MLFSIIYNIHIILQFFSYGLQLKIPHIGKISLSNIIVLYEVPIHLLKLALLFLHPL